MKISFYQIKIIGLVIGVALLGIVAFSVTYLKTQGEGLELDEAEIENIVVEFLKTTDVAQGLYGTVGIEEDGKALVVNYTTREMGHPNFQLDALQDHTAIITLNNEGEVVSAFCFRGLRTWDLINQRWIENFP